MEAHKKTANRKMFAVFSDGKFGLLLEKVFEHGQPFVDRFESIGIHHSQVVFACVQSVKRRV